MDVSALLELGDGAYLKFTSNVPASVKMKMRSVELTSGEWTGTLWIFSVDTTSSGHHRFWASPVRLTGFRD